MIGTARQFALDPPTGLLTGHIWATHETIDEAEKATLT
jgi:hypothetical protein